MGFEYLDGKRWAEITRDERFFCQRLYEKINDETPERFVAYLRDTHGLGVPVEGEWEAGFEVCFYRDLFRHREGTGEPFSWKRTFDLCLFGEKAIIIIEAKAAEEFELTQTATFVQDLEEVATLTSIRNVQLVGLCSSKYDVAPELESLFTGPILRWADLATRYGNDAILSRADGVYDKRRPFSGTGQNSDQMVCGVNLLDAFRDGAKWWVGRGGGLGGRAFADDLRSGKWREQHYEVNTTATEPPSRNYFSLEEFAAKVVEADQRGSG